MPVVNINERSWGIDLISCINEFLIDKELVIKRAGGENSLKAPKNTMFPDVLLFGDSQSARVLQGWELKMPDTDIDDEEFINNAHTKAKILKLENGPFVTSAALIIIKATRETKAFIIKALMADDGFTSPAFRTNSLNFS